LCRLWMCSCFGVIRHVVPHAVTATLL
jgi:hypothetical protein